MSAYSATDEHMRQNYIASEKRRNNFKGQAFFQTDEELGEEFDSGMARHDAQVRTEIAAAIRTLQSDMREGNDWDEEWSTREVRDALGYAATIAEGTS